MTNQTEQGAAGRFTKKPATIDAWMIDIDNEPRPKWVQLAFASDVIGWCPAGEGLYIDTLEGYMKGKNGDWLIRGVKGELYPCKPDIFAATYEPAGAVSTPEGYTSDDTGKSLNAKAADLLRPFLKPGDKVIWRDSFRWKDDDGVLSNHYDSMELESLAADFGYEVDWDTNFKHAAIIRPAPAKGAP